jgi:hypothetical protein
MFTKFLAFLMLIGIVYIGGVFLLPDITDSYWIKSWNTTIRNLKAKLESDHPTNFSSGSTLIEKVTDIAKPYVDESKAVTNQVKTTIETKTEQVKQAADSVEKAYKAVEWAKSDVEKLTQFWSGGR